MEQIPHPIECAICLESITKTDVILSCHHMFHHSCAAEWLIENDSCPMCRKSIGTTTPENTTKTVHMRDDYSNVLSFIDYSRIYERIIDLINIDANPLNIDWGSNDYIQTTITGGSSKNKTKITCFIHRSRNKYIVQVINIDVCQPRGKTIKYRKIINNRSINRKRLR
uniref:RING-type domain-containing protein n=1 Tax=viral metagenome TaxID=1070528 RepID=A0A6C0EKF5_9ZZZZ